jgi:cell division protein FtsB
MYAAIIAIVFMLFFTLYREVVDHPGSDKTTKRYKIIKRIILLCFILGAGVFNVIVTVIQNQEKEQFRNQVSQMETSLRSKSDEIAELNKKLLTKTEEIAVLNRSIAAKSDAIAELNRDIAGMVTGGDSYCYFWITRIKSRPDFAGLTLHHQGKYPLYNLKIKIVDVEKIVGIMTEEMKTGEFWRRSWVEQDAILFPGSRIFNIGNFGPNYVIPLVDIPLGPEDKKGYNIELTAQNCFIRQTLRFRKINGEWKMAEQLAVRGKIIKEDIPKEFPRDSEGKFAW